jgi:hypothetical protein
MKLLFIYNANSGTLNALLDVGHKLFSPSTYKCHLCALTFNTFTENNLWKDFRARSATEMQFFHIDEFEKTFKDKEYIYPIILSQHNDEFDIVMSSEKINTIKTVEALIDEISHKVVLLR